MASKDEQAGACKVAGSGGLGSGPGAGLLPTGSLVVSCVDDLLEKLGLGAAMRLLALDASTTAIGWAVLDLDDRHPDDLLEHGLETLSGDLWRRIALGGEWLWKVLEDASPIGYVAIETPVVYMVKERGRWKPRNAQSVIKQGYMVGALGYVALQFGLVLLEVRPDERLAAFGLPHNTRNPKPQVVNIANMIYSLGLDPDKEHDTADAIAVAWAARRHLEQRGTFDEQMADQH